MNRFRSRAAVAAFGLATALFAGGALADKPSWAGNGKPEKHEKQRNQDRWDDGRGRDEGRYEGRDQGRYEGRYEDRYQERRHVYREQRRHEEYRGGPIDFHFDDRSRGAVHEYYGERFRQGRCPPGLAKKGNGCMPPGQAKKWQRGHALPPGVVYYDLPPMLLGRLPPPPPHHRYVRVAQDILLIATGTAMVIDAIEDLGVMGGRR